MEVANAKRILAAEGSIVHVHDYQQVVEEFSVFLKSQRIGVST